VKDGRASKVVAQHYLAELYLTGRNLATFTKYKGLDPELSNQNGLPLQRDWLVGITLGL
jgi:hypothetical protein